MLPTSRFTDRILPLLVLLAAVLLLAPSLSSAAETPSPEPRTQLPKEPEKLSPPQAVDAYLAVLEDETQTPIRRNYAGARIVALGPPALPHILDLYRTADLSRRGFLASILGAFDPSVVPPDKTADARKALADDLETNRLAVHPNVVKALGDLHVHDAVPTLLQLLPSASDDQRPGLLYALAQIADARAVDSLFAGLDDPDRVTRTACANGVVSVLKDLSPLKRPADPAPKPASAATSPRDFQSLLDRVLQYVPEDKPLDSRIILVGGLGEILSAAPQDDAAASRLRSPVLRTLTRILSRDSQPPGLRMVVADSLGRIQSPEPLPELMDLLRQSSDPDLRRAALLALVSIRDISCVPVLIDRMESQVVRGSRPDPETIAERRQIVVALRAITGQSFSDNPDQWRQWWTSTGGRPPRPQETEDSAVN